MLLSCDFLKWGKRKEERENSKPTALFRGRSTQKLKCCILTIMGFNNYSQNKVEECCFQLESHLSIAIWPQYSHF